MNTNISEVCKQFSFFLLALEVGPWKDDGSGEVIQEILKDGSADGIRLNTPTTVAVDDTAGLAQIVANVKGCKVVITITGDHKEDGTTRMKLGTFYPQIITEFRKPQSYYLETQAPMSGRFSQEADTLEDAKEFLTNTILNATTTFYVWPGGRKTRKLVPQPPEGHELMVLMMEPNSRSRSWQDTEVFFIAVRRGGRPRFKNGSACYGEFIILSGGNVNDVKLPDGSYVHNGECWTVANPQCWWGDSL